MTDLQLPAQWTDDCQGKKDYDGALVSLSTRYWPRGGGYDTFSRESGWEGNETRPAIMPSATASIVLNVGPLDESGNSDQLNIVSQDFEGETQQAVQAQVEAWALSQYQQIAKAVRALLSHPNQD